MRLLNEDEKCGFRKALDEIDDYLDMIKPLWVKVTHVKTKVTKMRKRSWLK